VIQGVVLVIALTYTLINLLVDLIYLTLDPRIRYQ
jgi:ABC-type dipeptide/oligopeptide/nickel transport system permease component